jgi:hypothetical protein
MTSETFLPGSSTPSSLRGYLGGKLLVFNELHWGIGCKIFIIHGLLLKYFLSIS